MTDKKVSPTLIDLFDSGPEEYRKLAEALLRKHTDKADKNAGQSYYDRCYVHQIASELDEQHPEWTTRQIYEDPRTQEIAKHYSERTVLDWIREVIKRPRGRPRKPRSK